MSELSERVAREHFWTLTEHIDRHGDDYFTGGCACGGAEDTDTYDDDDGGHAAHVAEVTEAAVRETIAADIEALPGSPLCPTHYDVTSLAGASFMTGVAVGIEAARLAARGVT